MELVADYLSNADNGLQLIVFDNADYLDLLTVPQISTQSCPLANFILRSALGHLITTTRVSGTWSRCMCHVYTSRDAPPM
jgi:hypothetical protein